MLFLIIWVLLGIVSFIFARWAYNLHFENNKITLGTISLIILSILFPMIVFIFGFAMFLVWVFDNDNSNYYAHIRHPKWWRIFKIKLRRIWYLGS